MICFEVKRSTEAPLFHVTRFSSLISCLLIIYPGFTTRACLRDDYLSSFPQTRFPCLKILFQRLKIHVRLSENASFKTSPVWFTCQKSTSKHCVHFRQLLCETTAFLDQSKSIVQARHVSTETFFQNNLKTSQNCILWSQSPKRNFFTGSGMQQ